MKTLFTALRLFLLLTLLTGAIYPLIVMGVGKLAFKSKAHGSLVLSSQNTVVGSRLLAQKTEGVGYFWPRPSAADYATVSSGASNLAPTSEKLRSAMNERSAALRKAHGHTSEAVVPADLLFASASGLDPHVSPEAALFQVARVAQARRLALNAVTHLVKEQTETGGALGEDRVNVLLLNLALDRISAVPGSTRPANP